MNALHLILILPCIALGKVDSITLLPLSISSDMAQKIGKKIRRNECRIPVTITWWKQGEDHASLGIGHWIWYPKGQEKKVPETFPSLLSFMKQRGKPLPQGILNNSSECPWQNQEEFIRELYSTRMKSLREYLYDTIDLQAHFIMERPKKALEAIVNDLDSEEAKKKLITNANKLIALPEGLYVLIDYLNFKGEGLKTDHNYNGTYWGLKQVLLAMNDHINPLYAFVEAAKKILQQRINSAPPEKKAAEKRWKEGWFNRLTTYLES